MNYRTLVSIPEYTHIEKIYFVLSITSLADTYMSKGTFSDRIDEVTEVDSKSDRTFPNWGIKSAVYNRYIEY